MDPALKSRVLDDAKGFLDARQWYNKHGLPYKRSYLLWGPPGSGKTSFIQALAGHFRRNVCFMSPASPLMTDDMFKTAMQHAPSRSVLVLEDIDSLFGDNRKKTDQIPLTFSGLLNGLDGLGASEGQIIILTTNHPERLDPALIRAGRVDLKVEMPHANTQQKRDLFLNFYPGEQRLADVFADRVSTCERPLSMAALQGHFIRHRLSTAHEAANDIDFANLPDGLPAPKAESAEEQKAKALADGDEAAEASTEKKKVATSVDPRTAALLSAMLEIVSRFNERAEPAHE
jgi:chaperone BCS1